MKEGGVSAALDICRNTRGISQYFLPGLSRADQGLEIVEKSITSYGSVQMSQLEKVFLDSAFHCHCTYVRFHGYGYWYDSGFDAIEAAGDISPTLAGGIKVALITTVFGLIVAIILQLFYNYLVAKIDGIVLKMEDASIAMIDILVKYEK